MDRQTKQIRGPPRRIHKQQSREHFSCFPALCGGVAKLEDAHALEACPDRNCGFESRRPYHSSSVAFNGFRSNCKTKAVETFYLTQPLR